MAKTAADAASEAANQEAMRIATLNRELAASQEALTRRTREQQEALDRLQKSLGEIAPIVKDARDAGLVAADKIPAILAPSLGLVEDRVNLPDAGLARGYDPSFLSPAAAAGPRAPPRVEIPLPRLTESALRTAWEGGKPVDYVNFSVVIDRARRMPMLAAVNLQRSAVTPLLRLAVPFHRDQRVPNARSARAGMRRW